MDNLGIDLNQIPDWYEKVLPLPLPQTDLQPFSLVQAAKVAATGKVPPNRFATPLLAQAQKAGSRTSPSCSPTSSNSRPWTSN